MTYLVLKYGSLVTLMKKPWSLPLWVIARFFLLLASMVIIFNQSHSDPGLLS
jgi:cytochrome c-type biogenesis protein CcmH/NrfF